MTSPAHKSDRTIRPGRLQQWEAVREFFSSYFWFVFKNVVGWTLILVSVPLGVTLPGPGGFPIFLIGFALVTFPGKRQLTSRVMRGRGLPIETQLFTFVTAFVAIVATCGLMWFIADRAFALLGQKSEEIRNRASYTALIVGLVVTGLIALGMTWLVMRLSLKVVNYILKGMPFVRRRIRPWLRKRGINLLPSRRKGDNSHAATSDEIIEIHERYTTRLRTMGAAIVLWAKRAIALAITVAIFVWIFNPIIDHWAFVKDRVLETSTTRFALAAGMFAIFLFVFRAMVWRWIVASFGYRLPIAPAVRIWSTSELARYVPGFIWQVVGRVYLIRPYGVPGVICSSTQVLELAIFLLANALVAFSCLLCYGMTNPHGAAQLWLYVAGVLLPATLVLMHGRVLNGTIDRVLRRLGKPQLTRRLPGYALVSLVIWNVIGLLWQSLAIFVIVQQPLGLGWNSWWIVAGSYCLAWCAGFLAFWAPGGIGVREVVFIGAMTMILPGPLESGERLALLAFLSVMLRLWATAGELILASIAYAMDLRGALGRPDAPGRVQVTAPAQDDVTC